MPEKTKCPVCGDMNKIDEFKKMCDRCFWFLSPASGGKDFGDFMYRIRASSYDDLRTMEIRPRGFWNESIKVYEEKIFSASNDKKDKISIDINWSCGGQDGTLTSLESAKKFHKALFFAIDTAGAWEKENNKKA